MPPAVKISSAPQVGGQNSNAKLSIVVCSFSSAKGGFLAASCIHTVSTSDFISLAVCWTDRMSWAVFSIIIGSSLHTYGWFFATIGVFHCCPC